MCCGLHSEACTPQKSALTEGGPQRDLGNLKGGLAWFPSLSFVIGEADDPRLFPELAPPFEALGVRECPPRPHHKPAPTMSSCQTCLSLADEVRRLPLFKLQGDIVSGLLAAPFTGGAHSQTLRPFRLPSPHLLRSG